MKVDEIVETKELLKGELKQDYLVVYQEVINKNVELVKDQMVETSKTVERTLNIFKGEVNSTLKKVQAYPVEKDLSVDNLLETIKHDHKEIFI